MKRRDFLKKAGLGVAAATATVAVKAPTIIASKKYFWKMCTTWPPHFPVLGEGADMFAKWVEELSGGRMKIQVYGGGELVPPLGVFDAVVYHVFDRGCVETITRSFFDICGNIHTHLCFIHHRHIDRSVDDVDKAILHKLAAIDHRVDLLDHRELVDKGF